MSVRPRRTGGSEAGPTAAPVGDDPFTAANRRLLGLAGIGLVITGVATWLLAPIAMPEEPAALSVHYADNRTVLILTSIVVVGGSALMVAWYAAVAAIVGRDAMGRLLGRIGFIGMVIQIAAVMVAFTIFAAVAYRTPASETALLMTELGWLLINLAAGPVTTIAILAFAVALRRIGLGGAWLLAASVFAALAHLVVAVSFADDGFLSPTGGVEILVPVIYQAWIGAVAFGLLRAP